MVWAQPARVALVLPQALSAQAKVLRVPARPGPVVQVLAGQAQAVRVAEEPGPAVQALAGLPRAVPVWAAAGLPLVRELAA